MERAQLLRAFNEHFSEFVEDVLRVFPNDRELETVARALRALRSMNPRLILVVFRDRFSSPYRSQIESGDMGFFVDKDWKDDVKGLAWRGSQQVQGGRQNQPDAVIG